MSAVPGASARRVFIVVLACTVLGLRGFVDFRKVRIKAAEAAVPAVAGRVTVRVPSTSDAPELRTPFALIARIDNGGGAAGFRVTADGSNVCGMSISHGTHRIDCAVARWREHGDHEVVIESAASSWSLAYLELASHHGNSSGPVDLVILPAGSTAYSRPSFSAILVFALVLYGLLSVPSARVPKWAETLRFVVGAFLALAAAVFLASPYVSRYVIAVSAGTVIGWVILWSSPHVYSAARWIAAIPSPTSKALMVARSAIVAGIVFAVFGSFVQHRLRDTFLGNYSGFLLISRHMFETNLLLAARTDVKNTLTLLPDEGYDGQYMYVVAFDPLMTAFAATPVRYREVVDAVPYRFGRIGFPWLIRMASLNQWQRYPAAMMWLILLSLGVCAFVLAQLAQEHGASAAIGALVLVIPAFWSSVQTALPEPVAAALFLGGYFAIVRERWWLASVCFAVSLLVRETGILAIAAVIGMLLFRQKGRTAATIAAMSLLPVIVWRGHLARVLFPDWGWEGFFYHPGDIGPPFTGFLDMWRQVAHGTYYAGASEMTRAAIAYPALLFTATGVAVALAAAVPDGLTIAAVLYAVLANCLNYAMIWMNVGNGQRGTFELFVMLALNMTVACKFTPLIRAALWAVWIFAAVYVLFLSMDATRIRDALFAF